MRKLFKSICIAGTAGVIALGAVLMSGCGYRFTPLAGDTSGEVSSNGGFVVEKGNYVYFINGVESYEQNNTYGTPVKGALMRIAKDELSAGNNAAETVIPSLMVAGDYTSGIYIYGDRIYYATPNNVGNTSGEVDRTQLDFKSAALDGSDIRDYFRIDNNAAVYRFVDIDGTVYVVYEDDSDLISYNTQTKTSVTLAEDVGGYVLNSLDKGDPYIYYTMSVAEDLDTAAPIEFDYNQVYRVRADVTEGTYEYTWDQEYVDDNFNGKAPYVNLGEIVLDGMGGNDPETQFNPDYSAEAEIADFGYTYTLQAYTNGGIYFVRTPVATAGGVGTAGDLMYLPVSALEGGSWNSIAGNAVYGTAEGQSEHGVLEVVANSTATENASSAAYFYIEEDAENNVKHHYLYVKDSSIFRADVVNDGEGRTLGDLEIAFDASGATLVSVDNTSDETYHYVYFTRTNGSGLSVERAVYNGEEEDYRNLSQPGEDKALYEAVKVLDLEHAGGWYNYEVLDGILFFADGMTFGDTSYNYVATVDLRNADGSLMNNAQIAAFNEKYNALMDAEDGYFAQLSDDGDGNLSVALRYFFYTGETTVFDENIREAVELGKRDTFLYSSDEQDAFRAFAEGKGEAEQFKDEDGEYYTVYSYFVTRIGAVNEDDAESFEEHWQDTLQRYVPAEEDDGEGLPAWAWALIGVAIALVVVAAGAVLIVVLRKRRMQENAPREARMAVDTTDDRSVDVYAAHDGSEGGDEAAEGGAAEEADEPAAAAEEESPADAAEETPSGETEEALSEDDPDRA